MASEIIINFVFVSFISFFSSLGFGLFLYKNRLLKALLVSPILFYIVISLVSSHLSFFGLPIKSFSIPFLFFYSIFGFGILSYKIKHRLIIFDSTDTKIFFLTLVITIFGALIILFPIIKNDAFDYSNDQATYIVHSEYLQNKTFFEKVNYPKEQWIKEFNTYQELKLRMGAQFFMAFMRSVLPIKHTLEIYPAIIAYSQLTSVFVLVLLVLSLGGDFVTCIVFLLLNLFALNSNILIIILGFYPQTFGIILVVFCFSLFVDFISEKKNITNSYLLQIISFACLVLTYQEIVPFYFGSILLISTFLFFKKEINFKKYVYVISIYPLSAILFPVFTYMLLTGLKTQSKAIVGWNEKIGLLKYLELITGQDSLKSFELTKKTFVFLLGILTAIVLFFVGVFQSLKINKFRSILYFFLLPYLFAFIYFRFFLINPFDHTIGQSWNIYKIVQWTYWIPTILISFGIVFFLKRNKLSKKILIIIFLMLLPSFVSNFRGLIQYHTNEQKISFNSSNPLGEYRKIIDNPKAYSPATIVSSGLNLRHSTIILSILKDDSRSLFVEENRIDKNFQQKLSDPDYFLWVYYSLPIISSNKKIASIAGFDIYPKNTKIAFKDNGL